MDLNAGIHYPPLQSNSETRVLLLAPGEDDEPVHCFHLVIDLDADWEAPGVAVHLRPTPGERKLSHIEVKSHGGEVFQSFTVTTTRLENSSSLHPFQRRQLVHGPQEVTARMKIITLSETAPQHNTEFANLALHLLPEGRIVWIDAMCINQADLAERESQVKLMSRIYEQADHVHADLGYPDSEDGMELVELLRTILKAGKAYESHHSASPPCTAQRKAAEPIKASPFISAVTSEWENLESNWKGSEPMPNLPENPSVGLEAHGMPPKDDPAWKVWRRLLGSSYFQRMWVIQEFAFAKRITMWYGSASVDPDMVYECMRIMRRYNINSELGLGLNLIAEGSEENEQVFDSRGDLSLANLVIQRDLIQTRQYASDRRLGLLQELTSVRHSHASDQRDKIYGALALTSDGTRFLHLVSYSRPVELVFKDFAEQFVKTGQGVEMLYQVNNSSTKTLLLPTWLPDWSRDWDECSIYHETYGRVPHSASKSEPPHLELCKDGPKLIVDGALFDTITSVSKPLRHLSEIVEPSDLFKFIWEGGHLTLDLRNYPTTEDRHEVMLWTLMCTRKESVPEEEARTLQEALWAVLGMMISLTSMSASRYLSWKPHTQPILLQGMPNALGRSWCVTKNGYFGLVPGSTKVGDRAALFYGGSVPFVVRPCQDITRSYCNLSCARPRLATTGTEFELIGHGYFHGLMHGEAFDLATFKPQKITLV